MAVDKVQKAGVGFGLARQSGTIVVEVRLHHDTISSLRGSRVGFELLNGTTPEQAKKFLDLLNEKVVGIVVTSAADESTDNKAGAASV
jgi:hypothetical protein